MLISYRALTRYDSLFSSSAHQSISPRTMSLVYSKTVGGKRHGLYLGGKAEAKDKEKLKRWGVTHVLNVTPPKEGSIQVQ